MSRQREQVVILERGAKDRLAPKDFKNVLTRRYLPVLSLTYVSSVIGIAAERHDFLTYMLHNRQPYIMSLFVAIWVSIPAILWIFMKGTHLYESYADAWYKIAAGLMVIILCMSYVLFPEMNVWGLRTYFAATVPMLIIMYYFFVKGGLPALAAHAVTALGLTFLVYGASIQFIYP